MLKGALFPGSHCLTLLVEIAGLVQVSSVAFTTQQQELVGLDVPGQLVLYTTPSLSGLTWYESVIHSLKDKR